MNTTWKNAFLPNELPIDNTKQVLSPLDFPYLLCDSSDINFNSIVHEWHTSEIMPKIELEGDDELHGSSTLSGINVFQSFSKRAQYGKKILE